MLYKGQLRLVDSPLQVTMWTKRLRAVDFTLGYEVRSVNAAPDSKPAVIAETQLAAVHIEEQRLVRLSPHAPGVPAALDAVAERGLWLGPNPPPSATTWPCSSIVRCGSTTPRSSGCAPDPTDW